MTTEGAADPRDPAAVPCGEINRLAGFGLTPAMVVRDPLRAVAACLREKYGTLHGSEEEHR